MLVLAYHRIVPVGRLDEYPLDPELISATPEEFRWQVAELARHRTPVSLEQVVDALDTGRELPERAVAVTFDDGSADLHEHAFPILRSAGVPSTVFATTGYLDSGDPFWFELAAHLMMRVEPGSVRLTECARRLPHADSLTERRAALREIHQVLKQMPNDRRAIVVADWRRRFARLLGPSATALLRPLSWDQVAEMSAGGVDFGAHTVNHPNLTKLDDAELRWELEASRDALQRRLGKPIRTFAYPIGTTNAYDSRVVRATEAAGYRLAVTYRPGVNWLDAFSRFEVVRLGVTLGTSRDYFRAMLELPTLAG